MIVIDLNKKIKSLGVSVLWVMLVAPVSRRQGWGLAQAAPAALRENVSGREAGPGGLPAVILPFTARLWEKDGLIAVAPADRVSAGRLALRLRDLV